MTVSTSALTLGTAAPQPPTPDTWMSYFAQHSRSFRFAATLLTTSERTRLAAMYAYCRFTDDLVDRADPYTPEATNAMLDSWLSLSCNAYHRKWSNIPLVDHTMREMADAGIPLTYVQELIAGVRMDIHPRSYPNMPALRVYTYRVAGVIGLWLTELFGVHDPAVLARAADLGHAMQLTNILRDVGDDWDRGRVYLPVDRMRAYDVDDKTLARMCAGVMPVTDGYRALIEELLQVADAQYDSAYAAMRYLPRRFARSVAAAAQIYAGIHREIRRMQYNTLQHRAATSRIRKVWLTVQGWRRLRVASV